ncbi:MAG: hypothetical protein RQ862_03495 [Candidatus Caldarchaeales archaeon]|nr:hypothetical protein [Candidatus Caldarchaeales archaeon]
MTVTQVKAVRQTIEEFREMLGAWRIKFRIYKRGGEFYFKVYTPAEGWMEFHPPDWLLTDTARKVARTVERVIAAYLSSRLGWKQSLPLSVASGVALRGRNVGLHLRVVSPTEIQIEVYDPKFERLVASTTTNKVTPRELLRLSRQIDALSGV